MSQLKNRFGLIWVSAVVATTGVFTQGIQAADSEYKPDAAWYSHENDELNKIYNTLNANSYDCSPDKNPESGAVEQCQNYRDQDMRDAFKALGNAALDPKMKETLKSAIGDLYFEDNTNHIMTNCKNNSSSYGTASTTDACIDAAMKKIAASIATAKSQAWDTAKQLKDDAVKNKNMAKAASGYITKDSKLPAHWYLTNKAALAYAKAQMEVFKESCESLGVRLVANKDCTNALYNAATAMRASSGKYEELKNAADWLDNLRTQKACYSGKDNADCLSKNLDQVMGSIADASGQMDKALKNSPTAFAAKLEEDGQSMQKLQKLMSDLKVTSIDDLVAKIKAAQTAQATQTAANKTALDTKDKLIKVLNDELGSYQNGNSHCPCETGDKAKTAIPQLTNGGVDTTTSVDTDSGDPVSNGAAPANPPTVKY